MNLEDGARALHIGPAHVDLKIAQTLIERGVEQVLSIRRRDDRHVFAISKAVQLGQEGREEFIRMMRNRASAYPADGLDFIHEQHGVAVLAHLAQRLKTLADVFLRLPHPGRFEFRGFDNREPAFLPRKPGDFTDGDAGHQGFPATRRADHEDGIATGQAVGGGALRFDQNHRQHRQQAFKIRAVAADRIQRKIGHLVEQVAPRCFELDLLVGHPAVAIKAHGISGCERGARQGSGNLDHQGILVMAKNEPPIGQPTLEHRRFATLRLAIGRHRDDQILFIVQEHFVAANERRKVDFLPWRNGATRSSHLNERLRFATGDDNPAKDRRMQRRRRKRFEQGAALADLLLGAFQAAAMDDHGLHESAVHPCGGFRRLVSDDLQARHRLIDVHATLHGENGVNQVGCFVRHRGFHFRHLQWWPRPPRRPGVALVHFR